MIVVHHLDDSRSQQILWLLGDPKTRGSVIRRARTDWLVETLLT
jgi:hypothetical protein